VKLAYSILFTSDMPGMTEFYRDAVGLKTDHESPYFTSFQTGPSSFALLAIAPEQKPEYELCFTTKELEADVERLRKRGMKFIDEIRKQPFGRLIHMRDPEGTLVTLLEPARPVADSGAPELGAAIVNAWDFGATVTFYRDRLGLSPLVEVPELVEFSTGGTRIIVRARAERPDAPAHTHQSVALVFDVDDLDSWSRDVDDRGLRLTSEPSDGDLGAYAEVTDPDGNLIVFREPAGVIPAPLAMAEAFENDAEPQRVGIRKPVKKGSKAVSRVVLRPDYKGKPRSRRKVSAANRAASTDGVRPKVAKKKIASVRGAGPDRTRLEPRKKNDPERAKTKPAIGRLRKAERRTLAAKKLSVATKSRSKPVKRAAANRNKKASAGRGRTR
jgi:predicted enzyme related to lactoylglutathione lyase